MGSIPYCYWSSNGCTMVTWLSNPKGIRFDWRIDDWFLIIVMKISDQDIQDFITMGGFSHNLLEGRGDRGDATYFEIINISTKTEKKAL